MQSDSGWIAARRVPGGQWQDIHIMPLTREQSKETAEEFRRGERRDSGASALRWDEPEEDGSLSARDDTHEYRVATTDMWMGTTQHG